jgi:hypothetical protein
MLYLRASPEVAMKRFALLAVAAVGLVHSPVMAGGAGVVTFAGGEVRVDNSAPGGVSAGTQIREGAVLETGADGYLHVKFPDRGLLILRPNSRVVVSDYASDESDRSRTRIRIEVSSGVVRHITGEWAKRKPEQFRVNTPVAALGVRGTDFTIFANPAVTRAAVAAGGIVMTPIGEDCQTDALGPCEGVLATELFANSQRFVLQATANGSKPEILDGHSPGIHPDAAAPPSPAEPTPDATQGLNNPRDRKDQTALSADTLDKNELAGAKLTQASPAQPLVKWGRWSTLLDPANPGDIRAGRERVASNGHFALYRDISPAFTMPNEGVASFQLKDQESYFRDQRRGLILPAAIDGARLSVDFGRQTFATSFNVRAENLNATVSANGGLFPDGRFVSSVISSNAAVSGALAGEDASQAGLLFNHRVNDHITAYGATSWTR